MKCFVDKIVRKSTLQQSGIYSLSNFLISNYLPKSFLAIMKLMYFISSSAWLLTFRPYSLMSKDAHLFLLKLNPK